MKIKKILILSMIVILSLACATVLFACDKDGGTKNPGDVSGECAHSWIVQETEPTCLNKGYKTTVCELCGKIKNVEEIPALGHEIVKHEGKAATCEEGGWKAYETCNRCSYTTYQAISALDHTAPTYYPSKPATCTEDGYEAYAGCERCHKIIDGQIAVIPALGHELRDVDRQDSTCDEVGWEAHKACSRCDYKEDYVEIPMHHYGNDGYCVDCGQAYCAEYLEMELNDTETEYIVTGFKENVPADVIIYATNKGLPITTIGTLAFYQCDKLESITIGENVKTIDYNAIGYCENLSVANWNATKCELVVNGAFSNCTNLEKVTIGNNVQSIPTRAFISGSSLKGVYIQDLKEWCNIEFGDAYANPLFKAKNLYLNGELVEDLIIPDGVAEIKEYAFYGNNALKTLTIPDGVMVIDDYAFYNCSNLEEVTIGDGVMSIGERAFYQCEKLQNLTMGSGVTNIGNYAFYHCNGLQNVYINDFAAYLNIDFVGTLSSNPLYYTQNLYINDVLVEDVVIPADVTELQDNIFYDCDFITSVTIPEGVTSIGHDAFYSCDNLESVTIPSTVTKIGRNAFGYCNKLKKTDIADVAAWCNIAFVNEQSNPLYYAKNLYLNGEFVEDLVIPEGVTEIKPYAFYFCQSIQSVKLPSTLTKIGYLAFNVCSYLKDVYITDVAMWCNLEGFQRWDNLYFNGAPIENLVIPEGVTAIPKNAFKECSSIKTVTIPSTVTTIGEEAFIGCSSLTSVVIPDGVKTIEYKAFERCWGLKEVTIGSGVTEIGTDAFRHCSGLTSIVIPSNVFEIGGSAFYGCSGLEEVTICDGVAIISFYAFYGCKKLASVTIPDSVYCIEDNAFGRCSALKTVTIGTGVEIIDSSAFFNCEDLTSVYITDLAAWCNIEFGRYDANPLYYAHNLYLNGELVTDLVIPDTVTEIKNYAFYGCESLISATIPASVTSIGKYTFCNCTGFVTGITFADAENWYYTTSSSDWQNKINGTAYEFLDAAENAHNLWSVYYWYKAE